MKQLTLGMFTRIGPPGSFDHYFSYKTKDGTELCLESCLNGYCVAVYDAGEDIIDKKRCTNIKGMMESQLMPGFSLNSGEALQKAIKIANKYFLKYL